MLFTKFNLPITKLSFVLGKMEFRHSLDFDSFMECKSIAASTEEILWSDDDTIIAEQEVVWNEGNYIVVFLIININKYKFVCYKLAKVI